VLGNTTLTTGMVYDIHAVSEAGGLTFAWPLALHSTDGHHR